MKEKFYNFIDFLSCELHFFEYLFYIVFIGIIFYFFEYFNFPIHILEIMIYCCVSCAFMNTWEINSKKYKNNKKKDFDHNDKIEK